MPQPKKPNLQSDPVVDALASDPSQPPPGTTLLSGFLGKSPTAGVWRLYLDPALTEYVEVAEADIKHSETLPDASGTNIWVLSTAPLKHVRTATQDVQAEFLGGSITDELLATAPRPVPGGPRPVPTPPVSIALPCISRPCPSRTSQCVSTGCPSVAKPCLSQQIRCNSAVDACPSRFGCQSQAFVCPSVNIRCQTLGIACIPSRFTICQSEQLCPSLPNGCPQPSEAFICPSTNACPSIAGCPSDFCDPFGGGFDPGQAGGGGIG